jgi:hypothetical protein
MTKMAIYTVGFLSRCDVNDKVSLILTKHGSQNFGFLQKRRHPILCFTSSKVAPITNRKENIQLQSIATMKTSIILVTAFLTSHVVGAVKQLEKKQHLRHPRELQHVGTPRTPGGGRYGRRGPVSKGKGASDGDDDDGVRMHQSDLVVRSTVFR